MRKIRTRYSSDFYTEEGNTMEEFISQIKKQAEQAITELIEVSDIKHGSILVVGCSTSEVVGSKIGTNSAYEVAEAMFEAMYPVTKEHGIYIAAQCCEHLNRALIIEREAAEKFGYEPVCVVPQPKAGGSFATTTYRHLADPVAVEHIVARAGIDIGGTLIGMHLADVAVPVRLSLNKIGEANILCAKTRAKYIGGPRAMYE